MTISLIPNQLFDVTEDAVGETGTPTAPGVFQPIAQYEILAQPLAPVKDVPYVQQGFFTQIQRSSGSTADSQITLRFVSNPIIGSNPQPPIKFFADYIIDNGAPVIYTDKFFNNGYAQFLSINLPVRSSIIFGIQYIYNPRLNSERIGSTPAESAASRGVVYITSSVPGPYAILSTVRQVFTTFDEKLNPVSFSESAYAVPLITTVNI